MAESLLSSIIGKLDSAAISDIASRLEVCGQTTSKVVNASLTAMLGAVIAKSDDDPALRKIFDLVTHTPAGISLADVTGAHGPNTFKDLGSKFLAIIFGNSPQAVHGAVSRACGVGSNAVSSVMAMTAPIVLSALSRRVTERGLTTVSLKRTLHAEAAAIAAQLPAELNSMWGGAALTTHGHFPSPSSGTAGSRWPVSLLLFIAALGIIWIIGRARAPLIEATQIEHPHTQERSRLRDAGYDRYVERTLPGEISVTVLKDSLENRLVSFLQNSPTVLIETWFDFDRVAFELNSSVLAPDSKAQLENVATILKCYSSVKVKIAGYTDELADPSANESLSEDRANLVATELNRLGVAAWRLQTEGLGSRYTTGDSSSEMGRTRNRRISLRVTAM